MSYFSENRIAPELKIASDNTANLQAGLVNTNLNISPTINGGNFSLCSCGRLVDRNEIMEDEHGIDARQTYVSDPSIDIMFICGKVKNEIGLSELESIRLRISSFARDLGVQEDKSSVRIREALRSVKDDSNIFRFANTFVWLSNKIAVESAKGMKSSIEAQSQEYFKPGITQYTFLLALALSFTGTNRREIKIIFSNFKKAYRVKRSLKEMFKEYMENPVTFNYQILIDLNTSELKHQIVNGGLEEKWGLKSKSYSRSHGRRVEAWERLNRTSKDKASLCFATSKGIEGRISLII